MLLRAVLLFILFRPDADFFMCEGDFYFYKWGRKSDLSSRFLALYIRLTFFWLFFLFSFFLSLPLISETGDSLLPMSIVYFSNFYLERDDLKPPSFLFCSLIEFEPGILVLLFYFVLWLSDLTEGRAYSTIFIYSYRLK